MDAVRRHGWLFQFAWIAHAVLTPCASAFPRNARFFWLGVSRLSPTLSRVPMLEFDPKPLRAGAMSLSLLKFVGQASLVDDAMLPS